MRPMMRILMVRMMMMFSKVKINGSSEEMLAFAAEMFGDKSTEEVGWSSFSYHIKPPMPTSSHKNNSKNSKIFL